MNIELGGIYDFDIKIVPWRSVHDRSRADVVIEVASKAGDPKPAVLSFTICGSAQVENLRKAVFAFRDALVQAEVHDRVDEERERSLDWPHLTEEQRRVRVDLPTAPLNIIP